MKSEGLSPINRSPMLMIQMFLTKEQRNGPKTGFKMAIIDRLSELDVCTLISLAFSYRFIGIFSFSKVKPVHFGHINLPR